MKEDVRMWKQVSAFIEEDWPMYEECELWDIYPEERYPEFEIE